MPSEPKLRDTTWDSRGTPPERLSQGLSDIGTAKIESVQSHNPTVPLSQALGDGTPGQQQSLGTPLGTMKNNQTKSMRGEINAGR